MEPILTRCGNRCDLCLAYRPNIQDNPSNRQKLSNGFYKYYGFRLPPEQICCDGCMAADSGLIDKNCPVRPCVIERGLDNCSQCELYVCEKYTQRLVTYEQVKQRINAEIPQDDYICFIRPYENKQRLDAIRTSGEKKPE
jgi:hypothetical protein